MLTEPAGISSVELRKIPPELSHFVLRRGEWSFCAMEHSRIGPIQFDAPSMPFHHLALPLERVPLKIGLNVGGRRQYGRNAPDMLTMIEAGVGGWSMWDGVFESACFYFTSDALCFALGLESRETENAVHTRVELHAPILVRLLHALHTDAATGQPHGTLVGDAIFVALASELVPNARHIRGTYRPRTEDRRTMDALEYIHANLTDALSIAAISAAAATSPFYLNHVFRAVLGVSIWQYVLRERARFAMALMRNQRSSLTAVSQLAGFETYASFISAMRREFGAPPIQLRRTLRT